MRGDRGRMAQNRMLCLAAAVLLSALIITAADSQLDGCPDATFSRFMGTKSTGAKFVDHTQLIDKGPIKQVSLYFNQASGCLRGAKVVFGSDPTPGMIGTSANTSERAVQLREGEFINKADYKASAKCIEYLKLQTNKGRSVTAGSASAPAAMMAAAANKNKGRLVAIRGFQGMHGSGPSHLQQLQLVWGSEQCQQARVSASSVNTDPSVCAPKLDMCNEEASMNQFSYCVWNSPFTTSACRGGCCFSSGKCASSSCAISGVGKDVAHMICYGTNSGVGFGGSALCSGLACKLAATGCTTDAFGGNCVGTVVHYAPGVEVHPDSKRYIGATCLDATPSDHTLDNNGQPAGTSGNYMSKLWTICDCSTDGSDPLAGAPNLLNLTGISNLTKNDVLLAVSQVLPKINLTDMITPDEDAGKSVLPSFTEIFKKPAGLPTITLPSFLNIDRHNSSSSSSDSLPVQFQLPDLSTLLQGLAAKANSSNTSDVSIAALSEPSLAPPITPGTVAAIPVKTAASAAKTAATALTGLRGWLGKIMPTLSSSNMRTAADAADDTPVATAATPTPAPATTAETTEAPQPPEAATPTLAAAPAEPHTSAVPQDVAAAKPAAATAEAVPQQPTAAPAPQAVALPTPELQQQQQQQQQAVAPSSSVPEPQAAVPVAPLPLPQPSADTAATVVPQDPAAAVPAATDAAVPAAEPTVASALQEEPLQQQQQQQSHMIQTQPPQQQRTPASGFSALNSALARYYPMLEFEPVGQQPAGVAPEVVEQQAAGIEPQAVEVQSAGVAPELVAPRAAGSEPEAASEQQTDGVGPAGAEQQAVFEPVVVEQQAAAAEVEAVAQPAASQFADNQQQQ